MTTQPLTITEFLLARIDEAEEAARDMQLQAMKGRPFIKVTFGGATIRRLVDPTHILAECKAKRAIVELHRPKPWGRHTSDLSDDCNVCCFLDNVYDDDGDCRVLTRASYPCLTVRQLAAIDADHPDYRAKWAV